MRKRYLTDIGVTGVLVPGDYTDPDVASLQTLELRRFSSHSSFKMDSIVPFFCGDSKDCRTLGSKTALAKAKNNIEKKVSEHSTYFVPDSQYMQFNQK